MKEQFQKQSLVLGKMSKNDEENDNILSYPVLYFLPSETLISTKIVSEYDQEIPQSQTADNPVAPRGRAAQPSRDTRKTN